MVGLTSGALVSWHDSCSCPSKLPYRHHYSHATIRTKLNSDVDRSSSDCLHVCNVLALADGKHLGKNIQAPAQCSTS